MGRGSRVAAGLDNLDSYPDWRWCSTRTVPTTEQEATKASTGGPILMASSAATTSPAITSAEGCPHRGPSRSTVPTTEQEAAKAATCGPILTYRDSAAAAAGRKELIFGVPEWMGARAVAASGAGSWRNRSHRDRRLVVALGALVTATNNG